MSFCGVFRVYRVYIFCLGLRFRVCRDQVDKVDRYTSGTWVFVSLAQEGLRSWIPTTLNPTPPPPPKKSENSLNSNSTGLSWRQGHGLSPEP